MCKFNKYIKTDFSIVLFSGACKVISDEPDGNNQPMQLRKQRGGGSVMFSIAILGRKLSVTSKLMMVPR